MVVDDTLDSVGYIYYYLDDVCVEYCGEFILYF